jgi:DNA-directed RNA polymerase subunit RPC12/RpoP
LNIYSCPQCGKSVQRKLKDSDLVICPACSAKVFGTATIPEKWTKVPDDLSVVQIGSTGKYNDKKFEIVGRIRIQMKDDFRTLWCALYDGSKTLWIVQSLENIAFSEEPFKEFPPKSEFDVRAGARVEFGEKVILKVIFVGTCLKISYEGEIANFPYPDGTFVFVHAQNKQGNTVIIVTQGDMNRTRLLWGVTRQVEGTVFENTRTIDGWQR